MGSSTMGLGALAGAMVGVMAVVAIISIGIYILVATAYYKMFVKAGVKLPWLAYIPFGMFWPFFWTIKKSAWNVLWFVLGMVIDLIGVGISMHAGGATSFVTILFDIVGIGITVYWYTLLFQAFGMSKWWSITLLLCAIPVLGGLSAIVFLVVVCIMGFSKNVQYQLDRDGFDGDSDGDASW